MSDFKILAWLSLKEELGRDVNCWLLWAGTIQPQHITGWKLPSISESEGSIWRSNGTYPLGFRLAFVSCLGHLIFSPDPQPI